MIQNYIYVIINEVIVYHFILNMNNHKAIRKFKLYTHFAKWETSCIVPVIEVMLPTTVNIIPKLPESVIFDRLSLKILPYLIAE